MQRFFTALRAQGERLVGEFLLLVKLKTALRTAVGINRHKKTSILAYI